MISKEIRIPYYECDSLHELPPEVQELVALARDAARKAYAPYSDYHVGVAIELNDGRRFFSNNQENKAYPSGLCAERVGLFFVQANHPDAVIRRMVVLAHENGELSEVPAYPCGACRQVMVECQERQIQPFEVWIVGRLRILMVDSADRLMPLKFTF